VKRGWTILIVFAVGLAALLTVNTIVVDDETASAEVTIEGGQLLRVTGGTLQVLDEGPRRAQPIVLLHCYACSLHWWDRLAPLLSDDHRVIRMDLLGFGGSEKPSSGYSVPEQANLVAEALNRLDVQGAVVVGHSLGFSVATALAEQASELVDRVVDIDNAAEEDDCDEPFVARIGRLPVIGEALWRVTPDALVRDGYDSAFAPGYDLESGFEDPDQVIADYEAMSFTSYREMHDAESDFTEQLPLDDRIRAAAVPLLVISGSEDQVCDHDATLEGYTTVPGAETATIEGAGHSPNIERPEETAHLILEFAADAGDENVRLPRRIGLGKKGG
jgi:pimeloyl-ACP methyl ester carboxylesterase